MNNNSENNLIRFVRRSVTRRSLLLVALLFSILSIFLIDILLDEKITLVNTYNNGIRNSMFGGLLSVGGFLLSLKTFIVIKLKESVYDSTSYQDIVAKNRKLNPAINHYQPLQNLSDFLFWAVLSAIVASVIQLTVGLSSNYYMILFAIFSSIFAVTILIITLLLIKFSLNQYFSFINSDKR
tara:strand:- start:19827 stop:20372 length:546 start_codon:yes stop_codon:yes gene_type:complete